MRFQFIGFRIVLLMAVLFTWGYGVNGFTPRNAYGASLQFETPVQNQVIRERTPAMRGPVNSWWTERVITEEELLRISARDPELSPSILKQILARVNVRAPYYIAEDIKMGNVLKVPNNFSRFKSWTPMPTVIPEIMNVPKFVLVVKDLPFIGWYDHGKLVGDTHICIGKSDGWTREGIYRVLEKDIDHISRSYTNAYGQPAPMPWALRIYGHVWIHAGDIEDGYCSHGCINLPFMPATKLFDWANAGTTVMIVESLGNLRQTFERNRTNCLLFAQTCRQDRPVASVKERPASPVQKSPAPLSHVELLYAGQ